MLGVPPTRAHRATSFVVFCVVVGLGSLSGCRSAHKPIAHGPWYEFSLPVASTEGDPVGNGIQTTGFAQSSPPAAVVPISIRDSRPPWERFYYQGADKPEDYAKGISFVAFENFRPDPKEYIESQILAGLAKESDLPTWVELEIESFQVVVDKTELLQARYAQQLAQKEADFEREREWDRRFGRDEESENFFGELLGELLGAMVMGIAESTKKELASDTTLEGPPQELGGHSSPGVTCEIRATAVVHRGKASSRTFPLTITSRTPYSADLGATVEQHIVPTVQHAIDQLVQNFLKQAGSTSTQEESPPTFPSPVIADPEFADPEFTEPEFATPERDGPAFSSPMYETSPLLKKP